MVGVDAAGAAGSDMEGVDADVFERAMAEGRWEEYWADRDVRRIVAQLPRGVRDLRVDDLSWHRFSHAYGCAEDAPGLLARLRDGDAEAVSAVLDELGNKLCHQGTVTAAHALAVPFLIRVAADVSVHHRATVLLLVADACYREQWWQTNRSELFQVVAPEDERSVDMAGYPMGWSIDAARSAVSADRTILVGLLADPDPRVRSAAVYVLAAAAAAPGQISDALHGRLQAETDPATRVALVLAIAQLAYTRGHDPAALDWTESLWTHCGNPADLRLAGGLAWLGLTTAPAPADLLDVLAAVTPEMADVVGRVPGFAGLGYRGGLACWLVRFLTEDDARNSQGSQLSGVNKVRLGIDAGNVAATAAARPKPGPASHT